MDNNKDAILVDPALLQRAEHACRQRLEKDPDNLTALRSLGDVSRKLGNLSEAAAAYERLFQLDPGNDEVGYLQAVFGGKEWPASPQGIRAAPFVLLKNWLPREFHDTLLPLFVSQREKFAPVGDGTGEYRPDVRQTIEFTDDWEGKKPFKALIMDALPYVLPRLYVAPFEIDRLVVQVRAYPDGHFFKMHRDADPAGTHTHRMINFVYYFHKEPRPYTGGELLLFDSETEARAGTRSQFTRVVPEDNSIIFFPPNFYHSVVPIRSPSQDFSDSRFVINGHVCKPVKQKSPSVSVA